MFSESKVFGDSPHDIKKALNIGDRKSPFIRAVDENEHKITHMKKLIKVKQEKTISCLAIVFISVMSFLYSYL